MNRITLFQRCVGSTCLSVATVVFASAVFVWGDEPRSVTVGMPARFDELVLPGSELEVRPLEDPSSPIVTRITAAYPHGTAFRYKIVYYGLEPGTFDLKDTLRRKDGSSMADLPSLPVEIQSILPPGQVEPHALGLTASPRLGGYQFGLIVGGIFWLCGLLLIFLAGRARHPALEPSIDRPETIADRLRPILQNAVEGNVTAGEQAELERLLLAFWCEQLRLEKTAMTDALATIREHEEAGALLVQLETWLHRPGTSEEVDIALLLEPYQNLTATPKHQES